MRILIVITGDFNLEYGGGQVYVRNLVEALLQAGHEVKVIGDHRAVRDAIRQEKPELVHAHGWKAVAARAARESGVPCVVTTHHGGLVCPGGALLDWEDRICRRPVEQSVCTRCCLRGRWWGKAPLGVGRLLRRFPNIPFITPAMTTPLAVHEKLQEISSLRRDATAFIAPSVAVQETMIRNGIPRERTVVAPHGIKPLEHRPNPDGQVLRFAYVGRICHAKGFHVLMEAMRRLTGECEIHVIGAAHSKWEKRYLGRIAVPARVTFHGHLTGESFAETWAQCHVTVLPSIYLEVFGLVIPESFSLGRPVIATDSGGPSELVRNGVDGFVVPPNDAAALATAMQQFVDNPHLACEMAARLPHIRTMQEHVEDLERVYRWASALP
jgi:glycosyltransferase involved in cell wall biosynthesis